MRIAHIVSTFAPQIGGMGSVCAEEAVSLAKQGHEVTVFTLEYGGYADYSEHDKQFPFKIVRLKPLLKIGDAGFVPQILKYLKNNFDLVHLHYPFYGGAEWLALTKIPFVLTYHMDAQTNGIKSVLQKIYDSIIPKIIFAKAKKIIFVDSSLRGTKLLESVDADKIVEVHNGVDLNVFRPNAVDLDAMSLPQLKDKKIILFVGNVLPLKRLDLLIRAMRLLPINNLVLAVVGGGYDLQNCQQLARDLGVADRVFFLGHCRDKELLAKYYNMAHCVAIPSEYESFSLVAIEAMACGVPIIASDLPVFKNKLSQAMFFVSGSVESLVLALQKALSLSVAEKQVIAEKGRAEVEANYNWQNHMSKIESVYKQAVTK